MNLAVPFHMNNEINDAVQEFNIKYNKQENNFETLMDFVQKYPDTRINVEFIGDIYPAAIVTLSKLNPEIYVRLVQGNTSYAAIKELKEKGCKFFYDSPYCAENYCELEALIKFIGVTDVYVSGDLCYNLPEVSEYCHHHGVKLRLILNRIPNTAIDAGYDPKSIVFRPQDMPLLCQYIDTFEFDCGSPYDWSMFDVLHRAWFIRQHWHGDLREINADLKIEYPNDSVFPHFTDYKISCGRKCSKRVRNGCRKCEQFLDIAKTLINKNVKLVENGQS